jgi:hypothetical protein
MRVFKDGDIIEHDDMEEPYGGPTADREMLLVMRQAIARTIEANPSAASLHALA